MNELAQRRCLPCEGGVDPLTAAAAEALRTQLDARWKLVDDGRRLQADFEFRNYYHTTAFVNAVAWVAHRQDHHPDISFGFRRATVSYSTHAIGGLSDNDFICAAQVDELVGDYE
jgi:pterin-4-alpha-carbinolamine dehydratase (EC 4.2.1.96)